MRLILPVLGLQFAVAVQAREDMFTPRKAKVVTASPTSAHQADTGAAQTLHQAHVQPGGVVQPDDQRPRFLGSQLQ